MFGFTRGNPCRSLACFHLQELSTQTSNVVQTSILSRDLLRSDTNHCQYRMLYKEKSSALFGRGIVLHAIRICESAARLQSIILGKVTREANPTSTPPHNGDIVLMVTFQANAYINYIDICVAL